MRNRWPDECRGGDAGARSSLGARQRRRGGGRRRWLRRRVPRRRAARGPKRAVGAKMIAWMPRTKSTKKRERKGNSPRSAWKARRKARTGGFQARGFGGDWSLLHSVCFLRVLRDLCGQFLLAFLGVLCVLRGAMTPADLGAGARTPRLAGTYACGRGDGGAWKAPPRANGGGNEKDPRSLAGLFGDGLGSRNSKGWISAC